MTICTDHNTNDSLNQDVARDEATALNFFKRVYCNKASDLYLNVWTLPSKVSRRFTNVADAASYAINKSSTEDAYFCLGLHDRDLGASTRGAARDVVAIPGLWVEIDWSDSAHQKRDRLPDQIEARRFIDNFPLPPTIVVRSGHGFHVYWLFNELWRFREDAERTHAQTLVEAWQNAIKARANDNGWTVDATHDLARVYRVPGTFNHKDKSNVVKVDVVFDHGHRYSLDDFTPYLLTTTPNAGQLVDNSAWQAIDALILDADAVPDPSLLTQLLKNQKFAWTWNKVRPDFHDQSASAYDCAIAAFAARAGATDQQIADLIIARRRESGDDVTKALREDYIENTIKKVRTSSFAPSSPGANHGSSSNTNQSAHAPGVTTSAISNTHDAIGDAWLAKHQTDTIWCRNDWYRYNPSTGIWKPTTKVDDELWEEMKSAKVRNFSPTKYACDSIASYLRAKITVDESELDKDTDMICLKNGVFDLKTFSLRPFDARYYFFSSVPVVYDPTAACPTWDRCMREWTSNDQDAIDHLEEAVGYSLTSDNSLAKFWMLVGPGRNGKDTFLNCLIELAGSGHRPVDLVVLNRNQYELAELAGIRVVTCSEAVGDQAIADKYIKTLVSGEPTSVRRPFGRPFTLRPTCKIWWSVNEKPRVVDTSRGFWERVIVVPFELRLDAQARDRALKDKLRNEYPGIFNRAMAGLKRLHANRGLTRCQAFETATDFYAHENDKVAQFVKDKCVEDAQSRELVSNLYREFKLWCQDSGYRYSNINTFGRDLSRLGFNRDRGTGGDRYRRGLELRSNYRSSHFA